ncbi:hypothetical protein Leryth_019875 [Lithospermum erythrorhizon]|nr:hypothetical protein Leryth_019875 [Lithospermum erythrorhizon]
MSNQVNSIANATTVAAITTSEPQMFIPASKLYSLITHKALISHLNFTLSTFLSAIQSPLRQCYQTGPSSSLLLMPSWSLSPSFPYIGVKLLTHHPDNSSINVPGVQGTYVLFRSTSGQPLASVDATELTLFRTACISALASEFLSRKDSEILVMVGAGALAPHLIKAHLSVRPGVKRVIIWNRTIEKARLLADKLRNEIEGVNFESCDSGVLDDAVKVGDIISCATNSETPLVKGVELKVGAHLDMVGSFKHSMRECDDDAIRRGRVFIDNEAALAEAGELVGAFDRGVIPRNGGIIGDLVELIKGDKIGRRDPEEITVFKSVGSATVDLLSAQLVYENSLKNRVNEQSSVS